MPTLLALPSTMTQSLLARLRAPIERHCALRLLLRLQIVRHCALRLRLLSDRASVSFVLLIFNVIGEL